ncbi:Serine/threonine protein phosphatase BSL1-like protein [Heracleum sosnowskyi]|uniref:Serine/threonine protein phosphatase BSL1-like protein n=1 Tax=Heracleum sosnowskyi TaxID=360622 RepID=A0AAD8MEF5_9APIA|nr:Serine/threonine protein phosphatase BSL1-like protein [Heracleum sosnowskyi]
MAASPKKPWISSAPTYQPFQSFWDSDDDAHTLTAIAPTKTHGPRLILFGGTTAIEGGGGFGIRLVGVTNSVHCYDVQREKKNPAEDEVEEFREWEDNQQI